MLNMKKMSGTNNIFFSVFLSLQATVYRQKLSDVNGKKPLFVPDNFFMFSIQDN